MKHFIVERDCYHGSVRYRKGQIVSFPEHPTSGVQETRRGREVEKDVPVRHFVPVGAQSVSVESAVQEELYSLERAIELPQESLDSVYSDKGAVSDGEKLEALKAVVRATMSKGAEKPKMRDKKAEKELGGFSTGE